MVDHVPLSNLLFYAPMEIAYLERGTWWLKGELLSLITKLMNIDDSEFGLFLIMCVSCFAQDGCPADFGCSQLIVLVISVFRFLAGISSSSKRRCMFRSPTVVAEVKPGNAVVGWSKNVAAIEASSSTPIPQMGHRRWVNFFGPSTCSCHRSWICCVYFGKKHGYPLVNIQKAIENDHL